MVQRINFLQRASPVIFFHIYSDIYTATYRESDACLCWRLEDCLFSIRYVTQLDYLDIIFKKVETRSPVHHKEGRAVVLYRKNILHLVHI